MSILMAFQVQNSSLPESQFKKLGLNLSDSIEAPDALEAAIRCAPIEFRHSAEQLCAQIATLQAQNKELKAYAHMVAHDLKDPLAVLVITSDLITDVPDLTRQELKEYLGQIRSTVYDLDKTISSLLLFVEVEKAEVPVEPVDMNWILAGVQDRLSFMIKEYSARVDMPEVWPGAFGYAPWIEEVWANYISNAIKHSSQPPHIELGGLAQPDGMVRFWTRDQGPGIPTEVRSNLFIPYSHIDHIRKPGHGLGLSIVASIVEKLGGQVGVESELGQGSLFFFTLPASPLFVSR